MSEQQNGVSPASAGGAPAPDLIGTVRAVDGVLFVLCDNPDYGRRWVPVEGGGQYEDGELWRQDSRPQVGVVPGSPAAMVDIQAAAEGSPYGRFRRKVWTAAEDLANSIGCTVVAGKPRGYGEPDPRDADIERELTSILDLAPGHDIAELLDVVKSRLEWRDTEIERLREANAGLAEERDRFAAGIDEAHEQSTTWQARYNRLIGDALAVQRHLQRALGKQPAAGEEFDRDFSRSMVDGLRIDKEKAEAALAVERQNLLNEMDEHRTADALLTDAREEWKRADAERDRLRKQLDQHLADENSAQAANDRLRDELDLARRQYQRAVNINNDLVAERDRLRIALDIADGYRPKFQPGKYVRIGSCEGMVVKPKDVTRVQLLGMLQEVDFPTRAVVAIPNDEQIEPRRWVAGDPEPEIGTTVRSADGRTFTRRGNGSWHSLHCPKTCRSAGPYWTELLVGAPLVEVVSTDGD